MTARTVTVAIWIVLAAAAVVFETVALASGRHGASAGASARMAIRPVYGRLLVSLGWMWLGWHVFAR